MSFIGKLAALVMALCLAATAFAKQSEAADLCQDALDGLKYARDGYHTPEGVDGLDRLKFDNGYQWTEDGFLLIVDGFREYGAVRAFCSEAKQPEEATQAGLKKKIAEGFTRVPDKYCGGAGYNANAVGLIKTWTRDADVKGFEDRRMELQGALKSYETSHQPASVRAADAMWLRDVAKELVGVCRPNEEAKMALASAESALRIANENAAFVACVKARATINSKIDGFDAAAKGENLNDMKSALAALEKAATPVKQACAPSLEGLGETNYIIAAKQMMVLFREYPTCEVMAQQMGLARAAINATTDKSQIPAAANLLRQAGKDAKAACNANPAPETWANFIAWLAERNITRVR